MEKKIQSDIIKELFSKSTDVLIRPIQIKGPNNLTVHIFAVDGLVSSQVLDLTILKPLGIGTQVKECETEGELFQYLLNDGGGYHAFASEVSDYEEMVTCVLSGMLAVIFDGLNKAILYDIRTFDKRSISEPTEEGVLKGAKDSFVETLRTNTALIRRRIRSENLVIEQLRVGRMSKTDVALIYITDVADMKVVDHLRRQLQNIDIDNIAAGSFIEEFIVSNKSSLFPQTMYTQRPDRCSSNLTD